MIDLFYFSVPTECHDGFLNPHETKYENKSVCLNSSSPRQNGRHLLDDIFKRIFANGKFRFLTKIWLKFVPTGSIDNNPALV